LLDYRGKHCHRVYNLYIETVFAGCGLSASQVVLLLRGVCKGESSALLAEELAVSRTTVHSLRQQLQANGYTLLSEAQLTDLDTEYRDRRDVPECGGKKASRIATPQIHHGVGPTNAEGTAPIRWTVLRWWAPLGGAVGGVGCG
jgi:biotin operon repressor